MTEMPQHNRLTIANMPWEDRPASCSDVIWRYSANPIIPRDSIPSSNSIFNSAVGPYGDGFAGVFRCDDKRRAMDLHFVTFTFLENALLPYNRNGVLFPRKIGGKYLMLSRPSDQGHTPFGDIFLSHSHDLIHWGEHRFVMAPTDGWQSTKIGAGPVPIETPQGWLLIYHGVLTSCNGFVYSLGAAFLDLDKPWKVIYRSGPYLLSPQTLYECVGDVPNVVFPCATLYDPPTGRIAIYYGAADTVTALAFGLLEEVIDFVKSNSDLRTTASS